MMNVKEREWVVGFCDPVGPEPYGSMCLGAAQTVEGKTNED